MIEIAGIEIESIEDLWRNDRVREELIAKAWLAEIEKLTAIEDVSIGKPFPPRSGRTMNRKELLAIPKRKWDETLNGVRRVYVIPSRRKHESGYACMDFVAEFSDGRPMVRFGGSCDDVSFVGADFRMDCLYPHRIIRIWRHGTFSITHDLSSIDFIAEAKE